MHRILFSLKRADQSSRALQRKLLEEFGITPARYDLLLALSEQDTTPLQRDVHGLLGVKRPTAQRMIVALERLGFIERKRTHRRMIWIELTKKAFALFRNVRKRVIRRGVLWLTLHTAMGSVENMLRLDHFTTWFRLGFNDPAGFHYPEQRERHFRCKGPDKPIPPIYWNYRAPPPAPAFGFIRHPDTDKFVIFDRGALATRAPERIDVDIDAA